ncbi:MAG: hypothetical protein ACJ75H_22775 [Thermoanaerobaculia bacterium]
MRFLVACPQCSRQFDATERSAGATFACSCGATLTVPLPRAHDAAVVRCSSCGAPRQGQEPACRFCASEFTLHERDLDTICPGCMARVSGRARFCHFCGTPLLSAQAAAGESGYACPACDGGRPLASRRLGRANVALFECASCGGLWIEKEIFEVMAERARSGQLQEGWGGGAPAALEAVLAQAEALKYRPCVTCGALMNRRNYGRKSGVIVDVCARHGIWFDLHELDRLLRWIREGGEARAEKITREQDRIETRQKGLAEGMRPWNQQDEQTPWLLRSGRSGSGSLLGEVIAGLLAGTFRWFSD